MSSSTRYTPTQINGITDTSDANRYLTELDDDAEGDWTEDLDVSIYGEQELTIPGMGESADDCGTWYPKEFCDGEENHVHLGQHLCGRRTCHRCWSTQWARPRTVNVVSRLAAARYVEDDGLDRRAIHSVISPPEGSITSMSELFRSRSDAIEKAREHGMRGGVCIEHPWRVNDQVKDEFRALVDSGDWDPSDDGGIWRWIRENDTHWRDQVYWSPHFHFIGLSRDFEPGDGDDGWIIKNIKRGDSHALEPFHLTDNDGYEDMVRVVRYLLSHAGIDQEGDRQAVVWFGTLHGTNFDPEEELSEGSWRAIQRRTEEIVGATGDRPEDDDGGDDDDEPCPVEGCDGYLHPIWDVPAYLEQNAVPEHRERLRKAFDWAIGDDDDNEAPDDGWPRPRTEDDAERAFENLLP